MSRPDRTHAWQRGFALWDGLFAAAFAITTVRIWMDDLPVAARLGAIALLLGMVALYVLFGRPQLRFERGKIPPAGYLALMFTLFVLALLLTSSSAFILFALCPQAYMTVNLLPANTLTVLGVLSPWLRDAVISGRWVEVRVELLPMLMLVMAQGLITGLWCRRIILESAGRAELIEQLEASRAEVARLATEAGIAAERERLSAEIHDTLAQGFTSIITLTQAVESEMDGQPDQARRHLAMVTRTARENLVETRTLVSALAPAVLESSSLSEAVRRLVDRVDEDHARTTFTAEGTVRRLPVGIEVVLLRAAQESLSNVVKHAGAEAVAVRLSYGAEAVVLEVTDDGAGFDQGHLSGGFGLSGMRNRVEQVGGTLTVRSAPGEGTAVTVEVPV